MNWKHRLLNDTLSVRYYLLTCLGIFSTAGSFLFKYGYVESFQILNAFGNPKWDWFYLTVTYLGDSLFVCSVISIILAYKKPADVLTCWIVVHLAGIIIQILKQFIFVEWGRPGFVLGLENIYTAGSPEIYRSFPSGHACTIFSVSLWVAYMLKKKLFLIGIAAPIIASIVAYSRIYLGVHFLGDVFAGGLIGLCFGTIAFPLAGNFIKNKINKVSPREKMVSHLLFYLGILGFIVSVVKFLIENKLFFS